MMLQIKEEAIHQSSWELSFGFLEDVTLIKNALMIFTHLTLSTSHLQNIFLILHHRTKTWTTLKVNGIPPSAREGHTATVVGSKMYLFGGSGSSAYYNDLFTLDLETVSIIFQKIRFNKISF